MIDPLTLDQMRVLVAVAETGSFSAAARRLRRVQSAISQAVQAMETTLGVPLFDRSTKTPTLTDAGAAIVGDARAIIASAMALRARAQSIAEDVEAELTLAVDAMFPMPLLMRSLEALRGAFPHLPATVFTEALGGAEETLRSGAARMAIFPLRTGPTPEISAEFLTHVALVPVVAANHPLARAPGPIRHEALEPHVQLVLTGRTAFAQNLRGGIISHHVWRFADLATRLEFLLAGFGWCNMPWHMIEEHVAAGRLKRLAIAEEEPVAFRLYVVSERGRKFGRAGRWLLADLRERLKTCPTALLAEGNHPPRNERPASELSDAGLIQSAEGDGSLTSYRGP
jgi:DNA-binding transcriptional LysR family regulator